METTPHDLTATSTSSSPSTSAPTQILTTTPQKTSTVSTSSQTTAPVTDYLHYINESKTWIDALVHCEKHDSHLVHITNETVWAGVKKLVSNTTFPSKGVWVGLERNILNCSGPWRWSKGPNVNNATAHWSPDFHLNPQFHFCGKLAKGEDVDEISWLDESCFQELPFICQD
ncbi:hypothetical protein AGOR_G00015880 [Albula goreensis]|uniref:C-type lectin domain-containing protein n=1 Tax=Albula goreensis TaxID=1534307 RepID=A0A8T3ECF8_9TELE|nr:hypothetical protein AGOR_G00015880 [Albula goreensis]